MNHYERRRAARAAARPVISYPEHLPVSARREEILAAIRDHQVVVVAGETGSGKTTQLPKMCMELGRGIDGMIAHTQPRRIAARTVAERLADEVGSELGGAVGYAVRFNDRVGDATRVKVMTDGLLLAEIRGDRLLRSYDTIIVDEAHERSLNIDFLIGYLASLLPRRPDLKVIVTSATIDTDRFASHFGAPVVEVSGRTYPVEVRYRPLAGGEGSGSDGAPADADGDDPADIETAICRAVDELASAGPGDVLLFLPGERDIRDAAASLTRWAERSLPEPLDILPLYARLSTAEQHRVFKPHRGRRVVLATNVAETSLTVPGIRYVVDTGLARISRYSHRTKVQRLPIEPISKASADQRAGRCGRVAPGICIRLYSQEDYERRPDFTDPEILRTNLASVILQMAALRLGPVEEFPFLEPPDRRSVADGRTLLVELGALEPPTDGRLGDRLTRIGRRLADLPVDPRLARMLVEAEQRDCLREVTVIAAALSIQDPRERPSDPDEAGRATGLHRRFEVADSDFLGLVALWDHLAALQAEMSGNAFRRRCRAEFLHVLRVREWQDLVTQIRQVQRAAGRHHNQVPAPAEQVHRAVLTGLLSQIGMRDRTRGDYLGARNTRWVIGRDSSLARRAPAWAMAAALVETDRLRARTVARIEPAWAEKAGAHMLKHTYSDPWWEPDRGEAVCDEQVSLFGLPLAARRASYHRVDPAGSRRIFIDRALVERDWAGSVPALERRADSERQVRLLEERVRRRNLLAAPEQLADFYEERLPSHVHSGNGLLKWWRQADDRARSKLEVPLSVLVDRSGGPVDLAGFPDRWTTGDLALPLRYRYSPGSPDDGVTVEIPLTALPSIAAGPLSWNVPGHRGELVTSLVRLLPKAVRRLAGPAPETARTFLDERDPADGPLLAVLANWLTSRTGEPVHPGAWDLDVLAPHLRLHYAVTDGPEVLVVGDDLDSLRDAVAPALRAAIRDAFPGYVRHGCTSWEFGDLPRLLSKGSLRAYPALVDEGESVGVDLFDDPAAQMASAWAGTRRLLFLSVPVADRHIQSRMTNTTRLVLASSGVSFRSVTEDCAGAVADQVIMARGGPAFDRAAFEAMVSDASGELPDRVARVMTIAGGIMAAAESVQAAAVRLRSRNGWVSTAAAMVDGHAAEMVRPGFVTRAGTRRLRDLLRYLEADGRRLERLALDAQRDAERQAVVDRVQAAYDRLLDDWLRRPDRPPVPAAVTEIRWMIEELRVSLWAQSLGTSGPVSEARILREIERVRASTSA